MSTASTAVARFTLDEYHRIVASGVLDDRRVELLNGLIIEMAPEGTPHAYYSDESGSYLEQLLGDQAKVREGKPVTLPNNSEPEPDIAVVKPLGSEYLQHHPYPSDIFWLIEYADSSLTKDLEDKTKIYAAAGILEYWVVNLRDKALIVFREPFEASYGQAIRLTDGEVSPLAFPDLRVSVRRLMS